MIQLLFFVGQDKCSVPLSYHIGQDKCSVPLSYHIIIRKSDVGYMLMPQCRLHANATMGRKIHTNMLQLL